MCESVIVKGGHEHIQCSCSSGFFVDLTSCMYVNTLSALVGIQNGARTTLSGNVRTVWFYFEYPNGPSICGQRYLVPITCSSLLFTGFVSSAAKVRYQARVCMIQVSYVAFFLG